MKLDIDIQEHMKKLTQKYLRKHKKTKKNYKGGEAYMGIKIYCNALLLKFCTFELHVS